MNFGHVLTAMVTPMDDEGNVDLEKTTILIEHLINNDTDGLIVTGTTGESPTLSTEEKLTIYEHVVKVVNKRIPVIAGTGTNDTEVSIALTKDAEKCGVDGIMLVTPYYNRPNDEGLYNHFKKIAKSTTLPIMLYHIPGRTAVSLSYDTIIKLSEIDNIVSLKESSGDLNLATNIIKHTNDSFTVYSGDDPLTLPLLALGSNGVVSVASHIAGKEIKAMIRSYLAGDVKEAASLHQKLLPIMNGLFLAPSPAPVKYALNQIGVPSGSVRLPLVSLSEEEKNELDRIIRTYNSQH